MWSCEVFFLTLSLHHVRETEVLSVSRQSDANFRVSAAKSLKPAEDEQITNLGSANLKCVSIALTLIYHTGNKDS